MSENNFNNWQEFFAKIPFTFYRTSLIQNKYINVIDKYTDKNADLLEIAGGSGYTTAVVADLVRTKNAKVTYSDIDKSLVDSVEINFDSIVNLDFKHADAFKLPFEDMEFDLIFHQGFLEHFNDQEIIDTLKEQARVADTIVFDVPNSRRSKKIQEFGNERFLSHSKWKSLVEAAGLVIHYDTARRFTNSWKNWVPFFIRETDWFHRLFGEASIIVCSSFPKEELI